MVLAAPADAALRLYDFSIGGFADNAVLSGSFSGDDVDGDGYIAGPPAGNSEIKSFSMNFTGNSVINPFSFTAADANANSALVYSIGSTSFGPNAASTLNGFAFQAADQTFAVFGGSATGGCDGIGTCFSIFEGGVSTQTASVGTIRQTGGAPEPATWAMMILGFGIAGGALRRQRGAWVAALAQ